MKRIGILGASGRTGRLVAEQALQKGWQVNAQLRDPARFRNDASQTQVFVGNPDDPELLRELIEASDALLFLINISRKSDWPWAALRTPDTLLSDSMSQIIGIAPAGYRIVSCSAWGVRNSWQEMPGWFRWLVRNSNIARAYSDHGRQEELLENSALDWTIVRPVGLTNRRKPGELRAGIPGDPVKSLMISRQAVARFMINAVNDSAASGKILTLS